MLQGILTKIIFQYMNEVVGKEGYFSEFRNNKVWVSWCIYIYTRIDVYVLILSGLEPVFYKDIFYRSIYEGIEIKVWCLRKKEGSMESCHIRAETPKGWHP